MYPDWLKGMFQSNPCSECRVPLTFADIEAVGVRRPYPDGLGRPLALVTCVCGRCGNRMQCTLDQPLDAVMAAVEALYRELAAAAPPNAGVFQVPSSATAAPPARPSRRKDQPSGPPTKEEIRAFLARLRRMSFKAGSKGFKRLTGGRDGG